MKRKLSEIDGQGISTLVCLYLICVHCAVIDRDMKRIRVGHKCSTCGKESDAGRLAFPTNIHMLADMTQQSFHAKSPQNIGDDTAHNIATLLHFCTLREVLITNFLITHLRAKSIPTEIIERLLEDNKMAHQKFTQLFASVVGKKWDDAVLAASKHDGRDYSSASDLMKRAAKLRNSFLHDGNVRGVDRDFAEECINGLGAIFGLFVALHNVYTHSLTVHNAQQ